MAQYSPLAIPTENAYVEASTDGSTWLRIPGTASITESGGEAPTRESVQFSGVVQITGKSRPPTVEIAIAGYIPVHATHKMLKQYKDSGQSLRFRYTTQGDTLFSVTGAGNTVAIATTGAVTFAAATNNGIRPDLSDGAFGPGMVIKVGSVAYVVASISDTFVATVKPAPASAVSATAEYSLEIPSVRRPSFVAKIASFDNVSADSESQLTTTLSLAPVAELPEFEVVV